MRSRIKIRRLAIVSLTVLAAVGELAACTPANSDPNTYTVWDPYPQYRADSDWVKRLNTCGKRIGVAVDRTGYDTTSLANKALLATQQGIPPDVLVVDNPVVSTLAEAGMLTTTAENRLDVSSIEPNLLAAGERKGQAYGIPIGVNTVALYYNKNILQQAGIEAASIKDWASLTAALEKVTAAGRKGITFSALGSEEGSFQFLPWFWGAGGQLTKLDTTNGVAALRLWKDWVDKGYAPNTVINNSQTASWQEFASGEYAFAENGTWQLTEVDKLNFDYGVIPIPAKNGGAAPAPAGGEFVTIPIQADRARQETSSKLAACLTSPENLLATTTSLSYVAPTHEVQVRQIEDNADLRVWVEAAKIARGRTSDDLGTKYPRISESMWGAVQATLSGSKTPHEAMTQAQSTAAKMTR